MGTPIDFRALILARMKVLGWSQYRLAKESGLTTTTVNRYCSGACDTTGERLGRMLDALELRITG